MLSLSVDFQGYSFRVEHEFECWLAELQLRLFNFDYASVSSNVFHNMRSTPRIDRHQTVQTRGMTTVYPQYDDELDDPYRLAPL